jgi:acyl carrier protein
MKIDNKKHQVVDRQNLGVQIAVLIEETFQVPADMITDETRRGDLERWDSLGHLTLIEALRQRFGIEITPEDALEMDTVRDIKRIVFALCSARH